ncbi:MAG: nuclear transport factor 2 family protein [Rhodothermales bacterium]|nr:nuclear transport factor 2 family protein [Rhodothermales bacterium]
MTQTIEAIYAYSNANLRDGADDYSAQGALEFWSSGGLLQEIPPDSRTGTYDAISIHPKHIRVTPLVEGEAAVAHYYLEGSMTPQGGTPVGHYLTRVSQVFVREDGAWKVRASHWSPITGGAGTSQTALDQ